MKAVKETITEIGIGLLKDLIGAYFDATCYSVSSPEVGCLWITYLDGNKMLQNGQVVSIFYHPNKKHSATTIGKLGQKRYVAGPGQWAISAQTKAAYGNKCYYNILD